jgi:hypothetical protein
MTALVVVASSTLVLFIIAVAVWHRRRRGENLDPAVRYEGAMKDLRKSQGAVYPSGGRPTTPPKPNNTGGSYC